MTRSTLFSLFFIAFGLGWFSGYNFQIGREKKRDAADAAKLEAAITTQEKMDEAQRILQQGAKELAASQNENVRGRYSEELIEKMLKLFMIDISLRLQKTETAQVPAAPTEPEKPREAAQPAAAPEASAPSQSPHLRAAAAERKRRFEIMIVESEEKSAIDRGLNELAKQDFEQSIKNSKDVTAAQMENLYGTYSGRIVFDDQRANWWIRIQVNPSAESTPENPLYESVVAITDSAKKNSTSRGKGKLKGFSVGSEDPLMFIIEAGDDYVQIYKSKASAGYNGLFYESKGRREHKAIGRVYLERRN